MDFFWRLSCFYQLFNNESWCLSLDQAKVGHRPPSCPSVNCLYYKLDKLDLESSNSYNPTNTTRHRTFSDFGIKPFHKFCPNPLSSEMNSAPMTLVLHRDLFSFLLSYFKWVIDGPSKKVISQKAWKWSWWKLSLEVILVFLPRVKTWLTNHFWRLIVATFTTIDILMVGSVSGFSFMLLRTIAIKFIAFLSVFITIYKSLLCLGVLIGLREFLQANQFHY